MNTKRTMGEALQVNNLSAAALAFVTGSKENMATPQPDLGSATGAAIAGQGSALQSRAVLPANFVATPLPAQRRAPVSLTVRLPAELPPALLRVAMERKLRGERPCTQQDIVAEALRDWLERNATHG